MWLTGWLNPKTKIDCIPLLQSVTKTIYWVQSKFLTQQLFHCFHRTPLSMSKLFLAQKYPKPKNPKDRYVPVEESFCKPISWHCNIMQSTPSRCGNAYIGSDDSTSFLFVWFFLCYLTYFLVKSCVILSKLRLHRQDNLRLVGHGRMEHLSSRLEQPIPIPLIPLQRFQWNFYRPPSFNFPFLFLFIRRVDKTLSFSASSFSHSHLYVWEWI